MSFFNGTIKGYKFLEDLISAASINPTVAALDLAGFAGRTELHGKVVAFVPSSRMKSSVNHLDLGVDKRLGLKHSASKIFVKDGKVTSFFRFYLQIKTADVGDFVLYTNLPIELRGNILSRNLVRRNFSAVEIIDEEDVRKMVIHGGQQPEIMRISKGIRNDLIQTGIYRQAFKFGNHRGVYFSELVDGVHLDTMVARLPFPMPAIPCLTFSSFEYPTYATGIQFLHFDLSSFEFAFNWVLKAVKELKCLKQLHISGRVVDRNYNGFPHLVHISFEVVEHDRPKGGYLYPTFFYPNGDDAPGLAAIEAIRSLPTQEQEDRVYQLYKDLEVVHRAIPKHFPKDCKLFVEFVAPHPAA